MKKIRINNDIDVTVHVTRNGAPENFSGKEVAVVMQMAYLRIPVKGFTMDGNAIKFRFPASEQKHIGVYSLTVQVKSPDSTNTADKCDIFSLVGRSCEIGGDDSPNIVTESVVLGMNLSADVGGSSGGEGGTTNYNDLHNKPRINGITLEGDKSLNEFGIQPKGNYLTEDDIPELKGDDGYTPIKGVDYFTESDIANIVNDVTTALSGQIDEINALVGAKGGVV